MLLSKITMVPAIEKVAQVLSEVDKSLQDWRPAFQVIRPYVGKGLAENLAREGAPIDRRWPPLDPVYARRKQLDGHGTQPMVRTGRLMGEQNAARGGGKTTKNVMTYWPKRVRGFAYGFAMHFGGGRAHYPGRRWLAWNDAMHDRAMLEMEKRADKILAHAAANLNQFKVR